MFERFMCTLLTTELRSFSGKGSWTSERGSSGFFSLTLGKTFDCTNELYKHRLILIFRKFKLTTVQSNNKRSLNIKSRGTESWDSTYSKNLKYLKLEKCKNYLSKTQTHKLTVKTYMRTEGSLLWRLRWYETATNSPQNTEKSTGMCWGSHESWKQTLYSEEYLMCST